VTDVDDHDVVSVALDVPPLRLFTTNFC